MILEVQPWSCQHPESLVTFRNTLTAKEWGAIDRDTDSRKPYLVSFIEETVIRGLENWGHHSFFGRR